MDNEQNIDLTINDEKPVLPAVSLLPHLNKWISDCEKQAEKFRNLNMPTSEISAQAMAYAYSIIKQFIEENCR